MRFTVEVRGIKTPDAMQVGICFDREGLADLLQELHHLREPGDHAHLMTPAWGMDHLTEEKVCPENELVNHLRITLVESSGDASKVADAAGPHAEETRVVL